MGFAFRGCSEVSIPASRQVGKQEQRMSVEFCGMLLAASNRKTDKE
jgi:hypothetical protein